ncbi:ABC transporter substrate-binding protein [Amycolatopsis granulosa]|uniref:ABC transporter substrate-binding protein n=1 Tax=Amycolatopsis granulosa TaxID=185684 RepID=UPI0014213CC4|nr:ABC transporter substrate-binding protein [Amycolatopsis granulosa]NIH87107.1 ABC-type branched-subunit amino acid transport system substrate-binding protein [Amycolatopsis granulosa]
MKKRSSLVLVLLALLGPGGVAACGSADSGSSGDSYVLGAALPLSGAAASFGTAYQHGIDGCVNLVNERRDLPKPVTVKYVDTGAGETSKGIAAFTQLTTVDHATTVFSAYSSITTALAPLAQRTRVPVLNGGSLSPSLANQPWVWNTVPFLSSELSASVPYVKERMPDRKKAMLIYQDDVVGKDAVGLVRQAWEGDGRTLDTLPVAVQLASFSAQVDKVKAQDPDVIFLVHSGDPQAVLIQQLRSAGVHAQIVGASPFPTPAVLKLKEAEGSLFTLQAVDFSAKDPTTTGFLRLTGAKPGEGAIVGEADYCNGVLMWAQAAKRLVAEGRDVTGANLNDKFGSQGRIDAVGGTLELLPDHTLKSPIAINQVKDGAFTTVATVPAAG